MSFVWNNHLGVGFGSKSTRFKEWLLIPYTFLINIKSCLNVIYCINNKMKTLPETIIKSRFCLWTNISLMVFNIQITINVLSNVTSYLRLGIANIILSEQELSVQVRYFNVVIISYSNLTSFWAAKTHKSESLDIFTTKSTSSNHECLNFLEFLLNFLTIDLNLIIISAVQRSSVYLILWKGFEDIVM